MSAGTKQKENTVNIEIDTNYQTRNGKKVRIIAKNRRHHEYNIVGLILQEDGTEGVETWSQEGKFSNDSVGENGHPFDLVSPWVEPPMVDWEAMPRWATHVAQDENGRWSWYDHRPRVQGNAWTSTEGRYGEIPWDFAPESDIPWDCSLTERS